MTNDSMISIQGLGKSYDSGHTALRNVNLDIRAGEILALLGPNGAGKTTLISSICGLITPSTGSITVGGYDVHRDYRQTRRMIGLVPQEIHIEMFETVWNTARYSRALFGLAPDDAYLEKVLRALSLWDKRDTKNMELSGGMKRRVLIAKALAHEPRVLFLDEPTAGVDVTLRRDMWDMVRSLQEDGVTIILTTHYIEEAEEMADRIGIIRAGEILLVEDKDQLMQRLGKKQLRLHLQDAVRELPDSLAAYNLRHTEDFTGLIYEYDAQSKRTGITRLIADMAAAGISVRDLETSETNLEDVFLTLTNDEVPS